MALHHWLNRYCLIASATCPCIQAGSWVQRDLSAGHNFQELRMRASKLTMAAAPRGLCPHTQAGPSPPPALTTEHGLRKAN